MAQKVRRAKRLPVAHPSAARVLAATFWALAADVRRQMGHNSGMSFYVVGHVLLVRGR